MVRSRGKEQKQVNPGVNLTEKEMLSDGKARIGDSSQPNKNQNSKTRILGVITNTSS